MVRLEQYNNNWYKKEIGASIVKQVLWYWVNTLIFNSYLFPISSFKVAILRWFGAKVGKGVVVKPKVNIKYPWKLVIKNYCWIGEEVWIDNLDNVTIGSNVCLSQGAFLLCGNHNYKDPSFGLEVKPITLEEGSWIGAKAIVAPGVTVGAHAVLSINSVANKNLDAYGIYQGNPAIKVRVRVFHD
jgi:putative colanic acid biosynthesis acetyltransferase WcaF